jgi:hypothetical protein
VIVRYDTAPAAPLGPAKNWAAAAVLSRLVVIVTSSPEVAMATLTMPDVLPTTVLTEPAALKLTQLLPFQI